LTSASCTLPAWIASRAKRSVISWLLLVLVAWPLAGCGDTREKQAELKRVEDELRAVTMETARLRTKLPAVVKLEEDNKTLRRQVIHLSLEVDALRKKQIARTAQRGSGSARKVR